MMPFLPKKISLRGSAVLAPGREIAHLGALLREQTPLDRANAAVEVALRHLSDLKMAGAAQASLDGWHRLLGIRIDIRNKLRDMEASGHKPGSERRADQEKTLKALRHEEMRAELALGILGPSGRDGTGRAA